MMNSWLLLLLPLTTILAGCLLVELIIWSLFHPSTPVSIGSIRFHGVVPHILPLLAKEAGAMAAKMAGEFSAGNTGNGASGFAKVRGFVEGHIDHFLRVKLQEKMPMIAMFVGDKTIGTMKTVFMEEIEEMFPIIIAELGSIHGSASIETLVIQKIEGSSLAMLHVRLQPVIRQAAYKMRLLATVIGLLIGVLQLTLVYFLS